MHLKHLRKIFAKTTGDGVNKVHECFLESDLILGSIFSEYTLTLKDWRN